MWDKLKLRRPRRSNLGLRQRKKKNEMQETRALLAGAYDLSEDEGASDDEVVDEVVDEVDDEVDENYEEVCTH